MKISKVRDVKLPVRGTDKSAGIDFFIPNDFVSQTILPGESVCIPSGIKANVPNGFALVVFNKSGVALKRSLAVGACVIDEDYQGEIHLHVYNFGLVIVIVHRNFYNFSYFRFFTLTANYFHWCWQSSRS